MHLPKNQFAMLFLALLVIFNINSIQAQQTTSIPVDASDATIYNIFGDVQDWQFGKGTQAWGYIRPENVDFGNLIDEDDLFIPLGDKNGMAPLSQLKDSSGNPIPPEYIIETLYEYELDYPNFNTRAIPGQDPAQPPPEKHEFITINASTATAYDIFGKPQSWTFGRFAKAYGYIRPENVDFGHLIDPDDLFIPLDDRNGLVPLSQIDDGMGHSISPEYIIATLYEHEIDYDNWNTRVKSEQAGEVNVETTPIPTNEPITTPEPPDSDTETSADFITPETIEDQIEVEYPIFEIIPHGNTIDTVEVNYEMITRTLQINRSSLMPIPFGFIEAGQFPAVDELDEYLTSILGHTDEANTRVHHSAVSGIFVDSYWTGNNTVQYVVLAFPTVDGSWATMRIQFSTLLLRPVDTNLENHEENFMRYEADVRIQNDVIYGDVPLPVGSHIVVAVRNPLPDEPSYDGWMDICSQLRLPQAISHLQNGGKCKEAKDNVFEWGVGHIFAFADGLLYSSEASAELSLSFAGVRIPNGVNVRLVETLTTDSSFPRGNAKIIGWFDAANTPFAPLAAGVWLIVGDNGEHAVLASLVSKADGSTITNDDLDAIPKYVYVDGEFVAEP